MEVKLSSFLKATLQNIYENQDSGNNEQLFDAFEKATEKVMLNPTSREFIKHSMEEYRAVCYLPPNGHHFLA